MFIEMSREVAPFYEIKHHTIKGQWIIRSSQGHIIVADSFDEAIAKMNDDAKAFRLRMETG